MPAETDLRYPDRNKIVTVAEMQAIERAADAQGHSYAAMMDQAGRNVADAILAHADWTDRAVLILVGPGNNGGDGLVCARVLYDAGVAVRVYLWKRRIDSTHDDGGHCAALAARGVPAAQAEQDADLRQLHAWLADAGVIVDALLGTGANRPITGLLATILATVQDRRTATSVVVAVDCPSGFNCDTGALDPAAPPADLTVTFAYAKRGHYLFPGAAARGELAVTDIGTAPALADDIRTFTLDAGVVGQWLPVRAGNSHKGSYGKVLLAVGCRNYPGAAFLATAAAGRAGAGLVTGAVAEPVWPVVASAVHEATWLPLATGTGTDTGAIAWTAAAPVLASLPGYQALVLGCGLGRAATTARFVRRVLGAGNLPPIVIDADGLNLLAECDNWSDLLPASAVLTPHPAELGRLTGLPVAEILAHRWALAVDCAAAWGVTVLVKGPYTVIAAPDGVLAVLPVATPALATAGTGDVLAGVIGGLLAQGVVPFGAACLGAWLHGQAGLACAREIGRAGVLASDLLPRLPRVIEALRAV